MSSSIRTVLAAVIFVGLVIFGVNSDRQYTQRPVDGVRTDGHIIGFTQDRSKSRGFVLVVSFRDTQGVVHEFNNNRAKPVFGFGIGSTVRVVYSSTHPEFARVDHWWMNYKNFFICAAIGLLVLCAAVAAPRREN